MNHMSGSGNMQGKDKKQTGTGMGETNTQGTQQGGNTTGETSPTTGSGQQETLDDTRGQTHRTNY